MNSLPLDNIRVIELASTWAGPMCSCVLGDLGAEVLKVESPDGDVSRRLPPFLDEKLPPISFAHATVNRNKSSICVDFDSAGGLEVVRRLAESADIFVESSRPGALSHKSLDYESVCRIKPDIVYVSVTGFGQSGPDSDRPGYDPLAQAGSGLMSVSGAPESGPQKAPTMLADDITGLHAAIGVLAALRTRDRTGRGTHIDASLLDSMLYQSNGYLTLGALGIEIPRMGNEYTFAVPANTYACRDGPVYVAALLDSQWRALASALGQPRLGNDPDFALLAQRIAHRDEINAIISRWCSQRTMKDVTSILIDAQVPVSPVRSFRDSADDPHVRAREMLQELPHSGDRSFPITGFPIKLSGVTVRLRRSAPELGEHSVEILEQLGYTDEEISSLISAGSIVSSKE